ncbi:type II toxin-antitoxin system RelE/ParE family toxin [Luteibacter jiangsuensis]|uniref:Type II toxin-antitoxin system RelE/ParE family toxin n=1 Tax=Luteibacter jiangsuensis TaxID=637577 RepID=A0ABX0Q6H8_9GAMM|nr:type II toxin-antitoxin system RelE/ParE family toxin [Luteibacter jiangsuensis]NID06160.1 type II toxin-antitoxin system RelE/ParE family toxin [Luteibacter jiangsuensis]
MYEIVQSETFRRWVSRLRDGMAVARIQARLRRMSLGHPGDVKHVGEGVREMRIDHGPGYRLYYIHRRSVLVVLLTGGDKSSQQSDIAQAITLAAAWDQSE